LASVANHHWAPGPLHPTLGDRSVHVWRVELSALDDELATLLSDEERARAERFTRERERRLWSRAHGVLRTLVGRYLLSDPRAFAFVSGPSGKPALASSGPFFNLSRAGSLALYAFAGRGEVGVDVELNSRQVDAVALTRRAFGPAEAQRLAALDPAARRREFLQSWTRYEAELKRQGIGIGGATAATAANNSSITQLEMGVRAAGALAVGWHSQDVHHWDWGPGAERDVGT
jgi:4'-phosphopantetheinyl transferase